MKQQTPYPRTTSLKVLGKKSYVFSKLEISPEGILYVIIP